MNSTRSSRAGVALVVLGLLVAAVAPAVAVSASAEGVPDRVGVGETVSATFTVTDLYTDYDSWTLRGSTELTNATWTVTRFDNRDRQIGDGRTATGETVEQAIDGETDEVTVRVEGTVPDVENFTYDPAQSFEFATLEQTQEGGTSDEIDSWSVGHYTDDSDAARTAVSDAEATIQSAADSGADTAEAEDFLESAISAYENANFENAERLAGNATEAADSAAGSSARNRLLLVAAGVLVVLALLGGLVYVFLQRRKANQFDRLG